MDTDPDGKTYWQWGEHGKKYYFNKNNLQECNEAHEKAIKQGQAAHAHGYHG
jgi:hypothetical protein